MVKRLSLVNKVYYSIVIYALFWKESNLLQHLKNSMRINYKWVSCFITFPSIAMLKVNSRSLGWLKSSAVWKNLKICNTHYCCRLFFTISDVWTCFKHILHFSKFIMNKITSFHLKSLLSHHLQQKYITCEILSFFRYKNDANCFYVGKYPAFCFISQIRA